MKTKTKYIDYKIAKVSNKLIAMMRNKFKNCPYTCYVTRWDDGTFLVVVSSSFFDLPQHEAIRQPEYKRYVKEFRFYSGEISYKEYEEVKKGNPDLPYANLGASK